MDKVNITLPSKCLVYKDVDPSKIFIRPLKGKDEKLISELSIDNFDRKFTQVLANVLEGIDPKQLTLGDRKYVMLWLAIHSYSNKHLMSFMCENCLSKLEMEADLATLVIKTLPDDFVEPHSLTLSDGSTVNLRLYRVKDELELGDLEKAGTNVWLFRIAMSIIGDQSIVEKVAFLEELPVADIAKIRAFQEQFDHGPVMETTFDCEKCGVTGRVPVPFRIEMFFPFGARLTKYFGATS